MHDKYCSYDFGLIHNLIASSLLMEEASNLLTCPEDQMPLSQLHITMDVQLRDSSDYVADFLAENPVG